MPKQITLIESRPLYTETYLNDCVCGKKVRIEKYIKFSKYFKRPIIPEITSVDKTVKGPATLYLGICDCGRIFKGI